MVLVWGLGVTLPGSGPEEQAKGPDAADLAGTNTMDASIILDIVAYVRSGAQSIEGYMVSKQLGPLDRIICTPEDKCDVQFCLR